MDSATHQESSTAPLPTRSIVACAFLLLCLLLSGLWSRSHHTFDYWTSPVLLKENHRLSVGSAWGHLMLAYGWPSATSKWWKPNSEPVFGNEPDLEPEERALPEERVELARQQFGFQIDGVAVPVNYPFIVIPLWVILLVTTLPIAPLLLWRPRRSEDGAKSAVKTGT